MAVAETLPQIQQPVDPASPDAPARKPREEQRWITPRVLLPLIIIVVANLAIIGMIAYGGDPTSTATARTQEQTPPAPAALPAPAAAPANLATTFGEGRFVVGADIAPGTYETTGPSGNLDCYWERLKDTSGTTDSIIVNNLGVGPATVTIEQSDGAFQTRWCNTWSKVG